MDCGCEFPIHDAKIKEQDGLPSISIDYENINMNCDMTWNVFKQGKTKGIFQLEANLGQTWAKRVSPNNLNEIAALVSLIRPGCLRAMVDDKSMTQLYVDRKHCLSEVKYFHESLEPILKATYGVLVYQEQSMRIATDLAGFSLSAADTLRKAIGKKDVELMSKVEKEFLEKAISYGVITEQTAKDIFGWIRQSQRYAFNKSHAASYGLVGYWTAYAKAHFPLQFFTSWLYYARDKAFAQEEIEALLLDAFQLKIPINPPTLKDILKVDANHFYLQKKNIYFGLGDIKKIGEAKFIELKNVIEEKERAVGKPISEFSWYEFITNVASELNTTVVGGLVNSGAVDYLDFGVSRARKLFEYNIWRELNDTEISYVLTLQLDSISSALERIIGDTLRLRITAKRREKLKELYNVLHGDTYSTKDTIDSIMLAEKEYLGVTITCEALDKSYSAGDTTCGEILGGKTGNVTVAVEILSARTHIIKKEGNSKGQKMAFLQVKDQTGVLESVCVFSDKWKELSSLLYKGNIVMLNGLVSLRNNEYSLIVNGATQI